MVRDPCGRPIYDCSGNIYLVYENQHLVTLFHKIGGVKCIYAGVPMSALYHCPAIRYIFEFYFY